MPNKTFTIGSVSNPVDINVTGTLTAPTPTSGSGNTQVATKGYVDLAISNGAKTPLTNPVTGTGTSGYLTKFNGTSTITNGPALGNGTTTFLRNDGQWITPTNTTYSAGTGLSLSGTTINHGNSITAGTVGTSSATSGSTLAVPYVTYNATGHITGVGTHTHTITGFLTSHQDISGKANLASPAFSGTPTAPTAAAGTNSTQIATTAFVQNALNNNSIKYYCFSNTKSVLFKNINSSNYQNVWAIIVHTVAQGANYTYAGAFRMYNSSTPAFVSLSNSIGISVLYSSGQVTASLNSSYTSNGFVICPSWMEVV